MSLCTGIVFLMLCIQYSYFKAEIAKMNLVRNEYHYSLEMLKKIIQEKNCDDVADDFEVLEDQKNDEDKDTDLQGAISHTVSDLAMRPSEQDVPEEQEDTANKFQFISAEDEKQLQDLRKSVQKNIVTKKKIKRTATGRKNLSSRQISQLQKDVARQSTHDFTFHWPLELHHFWLSSLFGARKKANGTPGFHYGIDMAAIKGTPVKAAAAGTVIQAQYVPGYGNNILIQHNKYYRTRYAHLHRMHVVVGQKVAQGEKVGSVGDTGAVRKSGRDASHLHFEIYHNGVHVNPLRYLFN